MHINKQQLVRNVPFFLIVLFSVNHLQEYLWSYSRSPFSQYLIWLSGLLFFMNRASITTLSGWILNSREKTILVLYAIIAFSLVSHIALMEPKVDMDGRNSFIYTRNLVFISTWWLLAGGASSFCRLKASNTMALLLFLPPVILIVIAANGSLNINYREIELRMGLIRVSHIALSEHVVFLTAIAYVFSPRFKYVYFIVGIFLLFILGGRSSFYLFVGAIMVYEVIASGRKAVLHIGAISVLGAIVFVVFSTSLAFDIDQKSIGDMIFTGGLAGDNSFLNRGYYLARGFENLPAQFFVGDPSLIATTTGAMGDYMHNVFSAWQFFGFFFFTLLIYIFFDSVRLMNRMVRSSNESRVHHLAAIMLIYVLASLLVSKSIGFKWMWFIVGYWQLNGLYTEYFHKKYFRLGEGTRKLGNNSR